MYLKFGVDDQKTYRHGGECQHTTRWTPWSELDVRYFSAIIIAEIHIYYGKINLIILFEDMYELPDFDDDARFLCRGWVMDFQHISYYNFVPYLATVEEMYHPEGT